MNFFIHYTNNVFRFEKLIKPHSTLLHEYQTMKNNLSELDYSIVFCHNDLLLTNILYNERENKVTFIDFEYATYNAQAFDIANHFAEFAGNFKPYQFKTILISIFLFIQSLLNKIYQFHYTGVDDPDYSLYPDEELQKSWLKIYLQTYKNTTQVSEEDVTELYKQVNQFVLLTHFFWGCWALIQSQYSQIDFDFLE